MVTRGSSMKSPDTAMTTDRESNTSPVWSRSGAAIAAIPSRPTQADERVIENISTGTATAVNWKPK